MEFKPEKAAMLYLLDGKVFIQEEGKKAIHINSQVNWIKICEIFNLPHKNLKIPKEEIAPKDSPKLKQTKKISIRGKK